MKTGLHKVKEAFFARIIGDPLIMNYLARPPIVEAIPEKTVFGKNKAVVQYVGSVSSRIGAKENIEIVVNVVSYSHDLNETVAYHLERLFHSVNNWRTLNLDGGEKAFIRRSSVNDIYDDNSQLHVKVLRFSVLFGPTP